MMVKTEALKRGTWTTGGHIYHVNPTGRDERARNPRMPRDAADEGVRRGFIRITARAKRGDRAPAAGPSVAETATDRVEHAADNQTGEQAMMGALFGQGAQSTMDTTAYERGAHPSDHARTAEGVERMPGSFGETVEEDDDLDDDEDGDDVAEEDEDLGDDSMTRRPADEQVERANAGGDDAPPRGDAPETTPPAGSTTAPLAAAPEQTTGTTAAPKPAAVKAADKPGGKPKS